MKDTADGDGDLNQGGGDAQRVEESLVSRQHAEPGQRREDGGVQADAYEADGGSQVVKQGQVAWLEHASVKKESGKKESGKGHRGVVDTGIITSCINQYV